MSQPTSPGFKSKSTQSIQPRKKRPPPSQFSQLHWVKKHEKIKSMNKYGGPGKYTMEQIKQHNKPNDCWMVLNGHIFDITEYIPYHPGGNEILKANGKDGTILFYKTHRWVNIEALIKNCWIGQVLNYKPPNMNKLNKKINKKVTNPNDKNKQKSKVISRSRQLLIQKQNEIAKNIGKVNTK
eukprot:831178_1